MSLKKWEKEIIQKQIQDEQKVIYRLKDSYKFALEGVNEKIQVLMARDQTQSVIYQLKYQQALQKQLEDIYSKMSKNWYTDIDSYLKDCYEDSFYSTMYALNQEGIPVVIPFDQKQMAQMAAQSDYEGIKLSKKLYTDSVGMAAVARQEITRGIAMNSSYADIARIVEKRGEANLNQANRIVRTESHRITNEVQMNTIQKASAKGADVVKQWDSTIDKRTRKTHTELDGQLREIEQAFKIPSSGASAQYPGGFGIASEDINCRCVLLQRARWALDKSEVDKMVGNLNGMSETQLDELANKFGVSKAELIKKSNGVIGSDGSINHTIQANNYNDFKKKYVAKAKQAAVLSNAQAQVQAQSNNSIFSPEAYEKRKKVAWNTRFRSREEADKYYRPELDTNWKNYSESEKFGVWKYTENSNPMNKPLSGYRENWNRSRFDGVGNVDWGTEDSWGQLNTKTFIKKFGKDGTDNVDHFTAIKDLTNAIDKSPIDKDVFLVRGDDINGVAGLLESIMPYNDAYKYLDSGDINSLKQLLEGNVVQNHAFTSTGIASGAGFTGKQVNYMIYAPKGTHAIYAEPQSYYGGTIGHNEKIYKAGQTYSYVGNEAEIIVQRGTKYRITNIEQTGRKYKIEMEIVEQPDYFKFGDEETFNNGATRHKK